MTHSLRRRTFPLAELSLESLPFFANYVFNLQMIHDHGFLRIPRVYLRDVAIYDIYARARA